MTASGGLLASLTNSPPSFLQPPSALHFDTLAVVKSILDPLASNVADAQRFRRDENRRKRKRGDVEPEEEVLQLRQVYTNALGVKQVWEQARRILDAACAEIERDLSTQESLVQASLPDLDSINRDGEDEERDLGDQDLHPASDVLDVGEDVGDDWDDEDLDLEDLASEEMDDDLEDIEDEEFPSEPDHKDSETYVQDPFNLNDGFFSIDDFNKKTQFLEQQDARGEDDDASDEDEIDWDADPLSMVYHRPKGKPDGQKEEKEAIPDDGEVSAEEDGPTFGDADLNAEDSEEDMLNADNEDLDGGLPNLDNTNEVRYADFFAPPAKKQSKTKRMRALPKTQPTSQTREQDEKHLETDLQRAISDVRRDLLESEDEDSEMESGSDMGESRPSMKNMSTHEKQRAAIAAEIRRLEAANVAKRDWTLSGEARAGERPLNSLIEEDMEFERVGKPVPVITAEVSEEIEQLIKRRILAREFDEVTRRRPDAMGSATETRRGRVELDDTKPQAGLAEIYEQEHLRSTDPGYVDKRSAATKKQHEEITKLWKEVSSQLDLLSNLHFKPKRAEVEIKTVEDKPMISMEDARPAGLGVNAEESMLAPQEVYRPGEDKGAAGTRGDDRDVLVRKGGASVNKEEMTREEKLRRRRREKERMKKAQASSGAPAAAGLAAMTAGPISDQNKQSRGDRKQQEKDDVLSELRKGNVKVISKKGDLQDLPGKKKKQKGSATATLSGSSLKL